MEIRIKAYRLRSELNRRAELIRRKIEGENYDILSAEYKNSTDRKTAIAAVFAEVEYCSDKLIELETVAEQVIGDVDKTGHTFTDIVKVLEMYTRLEPR